MEVVIISVHSEKTERYLAPMTFILTELQIAKNAYGQERNLATELTSGKSYHGTDLCVSTSLFKLLNSPRNKRFCLECTSV